MTVPLLTKHARDIGASATVTGVVGSLYGFLQLFSCPVVGRWSDVSGRKLALLSCLLMSAVGYFSMAMSSSVLILIFARIPTGLFKHSQELSRAHLTDVTPPSQHPHVFGRFNSVSNIGFILGPVIGGYIVDNFGGFRAAAMATSLCFILNLVLVGVSMPNCPTRVADKSKSVNDDLNTESTLLTTKKTVWQVLMARFLLGAAVLVYRHDFISYVTRRYNSSTTAAGYVTSFASIVGTATGFFVGVVSDRYGNDSERLLSHSALLETVSLVLVCLSPNIVLLALCQAALSISCAIGRVAAVDVTSQRGGRQHTGTLMGTGATVLSVSRMLSPLIGGLSQEISEDYGPLVMSILLAAAGTTLLLATSQRVKLHAN